MVDVKDAETCSAGLLKWNEKKLKKRTNSTYSPSLPFLSDENA